MDREFTYYRSMNNHRRAIMTLSRWLDKDAQWLLRGIYNARMHRVARKMANAA
ncbi:MAG: hypothetical protein OEZ10_01860 [Gammaproteobacteria bacterium]|nr:hypothetical protein [Gammaproteobacteria bacterium]